jgi:hypothetical protein
MFRSDFQNIIGTILAARNPLSDAAIDKLLCLERPSAHTIARLGCVLQWTERKPVRILHPSFADFLTSRHQNDAWLINIAWHNQHLALQCLHLLNMDLKRNICDLTLSTAAVNASLAEDISYACTFWVDHVCAVPVNVESIATLLDQFFFVHILHWTEAMSVLHISREMIVLMPRILEWVKV